MEAVEGVGGFAEGLVVAGEEAGVGGWWRGEDFEEWAAGGQGDAEVDELDACGDDAAVGGDGGLGGGLGEPLFETGRGHGVFFTEVGEGDAGCEEVLEELPVGGGGGEGEGALGIGHWALVRRETLGPWSLVLEVGVWGERRRIGGWRAKGGALRFEI